MRIFILTLGTRGDFEPFWALGRLLQRRGHRVTIGTSEFHFQNDLNLRWIKIGGGTQSELVALLRSMADEPDRERRATQYGQKWIHPQLDFSREKIGLEGSRHDYFISNIKIPLMRGANVLPGAFVTYDPPVDAQSAQASNSHTHRGATLDLVAMNRGLIDPAENWADHFHFTGFWQLAKRRLPRPPRLDEFCRRGPATVVMTLGSMVTFDSVRLSNCFFQALEITGFQGVLVGGWSDQQDGTHPSGRMMSLREVDYDWLFQRVACVIHHGGVGTVASVLRAGLPSILLPQIPSQERWGNILMRENLCAGEFETSSLEPQGLALAMKSAVDEGKIIHQALQWKARVQADPGIARAVDLIEAHGKRMGLTIRF